ncbi:MAG: BatD family protein [Acidobacteria bacterium]|nr:BatD family protein [Acidobacteriota bacterium]
MRRLDHLTLLSLALCCAFLSAQAPDVSPVRFVLNKVVLAPTETLNVTIQVQCTPGDEDPVPVFPEIPGFTQVDLQRSVINSTWGGVPSRQVRLVCSYIPRGSGVFGIPPIRVRAGGREFVSKSFSVKVLNPDGTENNRPYRPEPEPAAVSPFPSITPADLRKAAGEVKLLAEVSKTNPWKGEQVIVTYKIQTAVPLDSRAVLVREPDYRGFWKKRVDVDPEREMARIETGTGVPVWQVPLDRFVVFPLQSGELVLEPVRWKVSVKAGAGPAQERQLASEPVTLRVKPLPPRPGPDNTDVGIYSVQINGPAPEIRVGQAVSLFFTVRGVGNLYTLPARPELPVIPGFETVAVREKRIAFEPYDAGSGAEPLWGGEKVWEITTYARTDGNLSYPAIPFTFFDPAQGVYRTVRTTPLAFKVLPRPAEPSPDRGRIPFLVKVVFFSLFIALLAILTLAAVVRWRRSAARGEKRGAVDVESLIDEAAALAKNPSSTAFFDILHTAVVRLVQESTGLSILEMRRDEMTDTLERNAFPPAEIREIVRIIDDCEEARFAGVRLSVGRRREMLDGVRKLKESVRQRNTAPKGN